jgi:hypothetical protein
LRLRTIWFLLVLLIQPIASAQENEKQDAGPVSRFAKRYLVETELAAEVLVGRVYHLGMGVDVVNIHLEQVFLNRLPKGLAKRDPQLVLAYRNEYKEGTRLFLLLKRYGSGGRLSVMHRLSHVEKNYQEKLGLIRAYIDVEQIDDPEERLQAFAKLLLENLGSGSTWTEWNSLYELRGLLEDEAYVFTEDEMAAIDRIREGAKDGDFKAALAAFCDALAGKTLESPPLEEVSTFDEEAKEESGSPDSPRSPEPQADEPQKNH